MHKVAKQSHKKTTKDIHRKPLRRNAARRVLTVGKNTVQKVAAMAAGARTTGVPYAHENTTPRNESLKGTLLYGLHKCRLMTGVFMASASGDYRNSWIRDQLYCALSHYYNDERDRFEESVRIVFRRLYHEVPRIEAAIRKKPENGSDYLHAKHCPVSLEDETDDWGHHQVDAVGLFLWVVGTFEGEEGISLLRDDEHDPEISEAFCRRMIPMLVRYLEKVEYWAEGDYGMWEEPANGDGVPHWHPARNRPVLHASSVGAAVAGLLAIRDAGLAEVPDWLITNGRLTLESILPNEIYIDENAFRDADMAQLSLIWPYGRLLEQHGVLTREMQDTILERVEKNLVQKHGVNRYWGDDYGGRSPNGVSGEWPLGLFWLAIIYADRGDMTKAAYWMKRGTDTMLLTKSGDISEMFINGKPALFDVNGRLFEHTPLTWAHSFALIAYNMIVEKSKDA